MRIVTREEMQQIDSFAIQQIGIPSIVLMESAGRSVAAAMIQQEQSIQKKNIGILCGPGNNGGDGLVAGRYLTFSGISTEVFMVGSAHPKDDTLTNLTILERLGLSPYFVKSMSDFSLLEKRIERFDIIIDALFGTGLSRVLSGLYEKTVELVNTTKSKKVYSIDIPSGLDANTGTVLGHAIKADCTVTLAFKKRGFFLNQGPECTGNVLVADISLSDKFAQAVNATNLFESSILRIQKVCSVKRLDAHKGIFGHVLILAGSPTKSGAAVLTSLAAMRCGAGLVTLAVPESAHSIVKSQLVEVMTEPLPDNGRGELTQEVLTRMMDLVQGKQVVIIGPGLIPTSNLRFILENFFHQVKVPIVLDADGLNVFGQDLIKIHPKPFHFIVTPHPGEMSRLTGISTSSIQKDRINVATSYSKALNAIVVLKGAYTLISMPDGSAYVNPTGNSAMATAGMGDVLTGMIGAYIAQGMSPEKATIAGVFYHGLAGDRILIKRGHRGMLASDVIEEASLSFG